MLTWHLFLKLATITSPNLIFNDNIMPQMKPCYDVYCRSVSAKLTRQHIKSRAYVQLNNVSGGALGAMIISFQPAVFSNEVGICSASVAQDSRPDPHVAHVAPSRITSMCRSLPPRQQI